MFGRSKTNQTAAKPAAPTNNSPTRASGKGIVPSVISADMHVLGNIISDGFIDIDGKIEGNVKCRSATVRPNGLVRGDIAARSLAVVVGRKQCCCPQVRLQLEGNAFREYRQAFAISRASCHMRWANAVSTAKQSSAYAATPHTSS